MKTVITFILTLLAVLTPFRAPGAIAPQSEAELTAAAAVIVTGKVADFTVTNRVNGSLELKLEVASVTKGDVKVGATLRVVSSSVSLKMYHAPIPGPQGLSPLPKKGDFVTAYLNSSGAKVGGRDDATYAPVLPNGIVKTVAKVRATAEKKPLKVFILAGQSNMEGHARVETFDYIGDDPATAPLLKMMRGADGKPTVCEGVWISYFTGHYDGSANGEGLGKLTAGYGARDDKPTQDGGKIGPEFTFGLTMDAALAEPVLIIKTAWGGKSLHTDFRPPGAGPYELNDYQKKLYYGPPGHGVPKDMDVWLAEKKKDTGRFYRMMIEHVKKVLADPARIVSGYDKSQGYEIAGFVWLQGFNDMVDGHVYPAHGKPGRFDLYSEWMAHFIRDVRRDVGVPKMRFVIGVMGVGGMNADNDTIEFRKAMAAPAALPEFKGNVIAVETAPFWSEELDAIDKKREKVSQMRDFLDSKHKDHANADGKMTDEQKREHMKKFEAELIPPAEEAVWKRGASNAGYHYLGCAKTFALMGKAFAEALLEK